MRNKIAFIGCSASKKSVPCKASELYQGTLFKKSLYYCKRSGFTLIFILSAKYGLLDLEQVIEPYEETLNSKNPEERKIWASGVRRSLRNLKLPQNPEFWFFCGSKYHEHFEGVKPFDGLSIGHSLHKINAMINELDSGGFNL